MRSTYHCLLWREAPKRTEALQWRHFSRFKPQARWILPERRPNFAGVRPPIVKGQVSQKRSVPLHIHKPNYADTGRIPASAQDFIVLHERESANRMRKAGRLARKILDFTCSLAKPGITTEEIDAATHEAIIAHDAYPSPLNYCGFPKSICSSINEVVVHGIPDDRPLQDGDVAKFDISLYIDGVHGDNCASVLIGQVDQEGQRLVRATQQALDAGIAACRPGACLSDVGGAIHDVLDQAGFGTVRLFSGHGIGTDMHMKPLVQHFRNGEKLSLRPGMIFTIEPMVTEGSPDVVMWPDGWTVVTQDGGRGAQFEHTVMITEDGVEILTLPN